MSDTSKSAKDLKSAMISGKISIPEAANYRGIVVRASRNSQTLYSIPVAPDGSFTQAVKRKGSYTLTAYDENGSFSNFTRADGVNGDIGPLIAPSTRLKLTPKKGKAFEANIVYPLMSDPITGLPIPGGTASTTPPEIKLDRGVLEPHVPRSGTLARPRFSPEVVTDWYRVGLTGWPSPSFTIDPGSAGLSVFDSSGTLLANNGLASSITLSGEPVGTYFLAVSFGGNPPPGLAYTVGLT